MKTGIVHTLTHALEAYAQQAKTACELSGHPVSDHVVDVNDMVDPGLSPFLNPMIK